MTERISLQEAKIRQFNGERLVILDCDTTLMCTFRIDPPPPPNWLPPVITADGKIHVFKNEHYQ